MLLLCTHRCIERLCRQLELFEQMTMVQIFFFLQMMVVVTKAFFANEGVPIKPVMGAMAASERGPFS